MKKLVILGNFTRSWDGSICDELHIAEAFKSLGWEVTPFQREDQEWPKVKKTDLVIVAQWNGYISHVADILRVVYGCPVVYWAFDYQWDSKEEWHFELAANADLFLSKELDHAADYRDLGANFHWFSQDFSPNFLDKYPGKLSHEYDVVFTGSYLESAAFRNRLLRAVDEEFDLHVFTVTPEPFKIMGLKNVHNAIVDHGLPELYGRSRIVLSCDWKQAEGYWSDRAAQAMCCGAFVLNKYVSPQEAVFHDYIQNFNTLEECKEKIRYYLRHKQEREVIAERGYQYAQVHLTVDAKVSQLLTLLNGLGVVHV